MYTCGLMYFLLFFDYFLIIFIACEYNHFDCVSWLLKSEYTKDKVDINLSNNIGITPLMIAVIKGNLKTVSVLCESPNLKIVDIIDKSGFNAIDYSVKMGQTSIFSKLNISLYFKLPIRARVCLIYSRFVDYF